VAFKVATGILVVLALLLGGALAMKLLGGAGDEVPSVAPHDDGAPWAPCRCSERTPPVVGRGSS
jgi:hypothetical protein